MIIGQFDNTLIAPYTDTDTDTGRSHDNKHLGWEYIKIIAGNMCQVSTDEGAEWSEMLQCSAHKYERRMYLT